MEKIVIIWAQDPDGSVFKAVMDALKNKREEMADVVGPATSVLRIGELEIYHEYRRVLMAGREVRLNHGEYAMLYCMASAPGQVFSKAQLYAAAWGEEYLHGTTSVENIIWRLRQKLEQDPRHPAYIKTVIGAGYRLQISTEKEKRKSRSLLHNEHSTVLMDNVGSSVVQ